jgi:hypothetical protein
MARRCAGLAVGIGVCSAAMTLLVAGSRALAAEEAPPPIPSSPSPSAEIAAMRAQLDALAAQNQALADQVRAADARSRALEERLQKLEQPATSATTTTTLPEPTPPLSSLPMPAPETGTASDPVPGPDPDRGLSPGSSGDGSPAVAAANARADHSARFRVGGYDRERGRFVLVEPEDPERDPFELRFDLITQFRYTAFARDVTSWTQANGVTLPVRNRQNFDVTRNWVEFTGYAIDPRLQFRNFVLTSTASNTATFLGWVSYEFRPEFELHAGYWKVPGSREWLETFMDTLGADRTMATTFFRPNFSPGIWATGVVADDWHYYAMIGNGFNATGPNANRQGTEMAYSASAWWEPLGSFGPGSSDIEFHDEPVVRLGTSFTWSRDTRQGLGQSIGAGNPENTIFRLSDGTPLIALGALGPDTLIDKASVGLWAMDAGLKVRGVSLTGEYYLRWTQDFTFTGPPPEVMSLFDHGGYAQAATFLYRDRVEAFARASVVTGRFGSGQEWGGGLNWFVRGARSWRGTFEVLQIVSSPADNILTGYRAGEGGTLFQVQMLTNF